MGWWSSLRDGVLNNPITNVITSPLALGTTAFGTLGAMGVSQALNDRQNPMPGAPNISGYPSFQSPLDASGNLKGQYQVGAGPYKESPWASMMKQQSGLQRQIESDNLAQSGAANAAQARSTLAMRGGLASGGAERIATAMGREQMMGNQNLARTNMMGNLDIGAKDYQNQIQNQQFNMQNALGALQNQNNYNMDAWRTQMQQQGANALAQAERNKPKSGLLGLGIAGII